MKRSFSSLLPFVVSSFLVSCGTEEKESPPLTPEQMYEQAGVLLKPHAEREKPDYQGALKLLQESANRGYLPAIIDLAGVYMEGSSDGSVKKDPQKAFQLYTLAATRGSADAQYYCGLLLEKERNIDAAIPYYRNAAKAGLPEAKYRLGRILITKNDPEAVSLIQEAAQSRRATTVAEASYTLAWIYEKGLLNVPSDLNKAVEMYMRSADAGDARSQYIIALMLIEGENLTQDDAKGEALLRLSAGQDYIPAIEALVFYLSQKDSTAYAQEISAWRQRLNSLQK